MAITVADNFAYNGKKPLDNRTEYATLSAMKSVVDANINEGCMCYNKEDGKYYTFKSTNTVDDTTGKWREFETGGGGQTYNDFTGATSSTAGAHGLVPAPSAGDEGKVLFGNGLWGALPSVDLSVLSNEAFIFEEGEKPVGMWTNRKLLWQKTVRFSTPKTLPANTWSTLDAMSNGEDIAKVMMHRDGGVGNVCTLATESVFDNGNLNVIVGTPANSIYAYTIQYTKTTDSPLPSGVKFAGVTSDGEVIYEKTISNLNIPMSWYQMHHTTSGTISALIPSANNIISANYYGGTNNTRNLMCNTYIKSDGWVIIGIDDITITKATLYYTLAS